MCGIAGILSLHTSGRVSETTEAMTRALQSMIHRGPNHQATAVIPQGILGHVRLSIMDLNAEAHQPMWDQTQRYILVFNGEIFNFQELRKTIRQAEFRTTSDTEVLLYLLIEKGAAGIGQLSGFFSFCFVDTLLNEALIARDLMGEKPLYYSIQNEQFYLCSELKPMLHWSLKRTLDKDVCAHFLQYGYTPPQQSIYTEIKKLERQQYVHIRSGNVQIQTWQEPTLEEGHEMPSVHLRNTIQRAVQRRLMTDVPICTFLSGGIDSSVVSYEVAQIDATIPAFTLRFSQSHYLDESIRAQQFAKEVGIPHEIISIDEGALMTTFHAMIGKMDEPFGDSSALALFSLTQAVGRTYRVALNGDGADELLGGYRKHLAWMQAQNPSWRDRLLRRVPSQLIPAYAAGREGRWRDLIRKLVKYQGLLQTPPQDQYDLLRAFTSHAQISQLMGAFQPIKGGSMISSFSDFLLEDQKWVLVCDMLTKTDRCGMWSSMELRSPFMDAEVVSCANKMADHLKIDQQQGKKILRNAYRESLPDWLLQGPKKGFEIPLEKLIHHLATALPLMSDELKGLVDDKAWTKLWQTPGEYALKYNLLVLHHWLGVVSRMN
jgi:asparagine synthase (glutamine-hydrolysing)